MNSLLRPLWATSLVCAAALPAQNPVDWWQVATRRVGDLNIDGTFAYDPVRGRAHLFAGAASAGEPVWEWDGIGWESPRPTTQPSTSVIAGFCHDAARGEAVLFNQAGETWLSDGADWRQASPGTSPPGRFAGNMAYDVARQRVVLFGGVVGGQGLNDTWEWDGHGWTERQPAHRPPGRWAFGMAYDVHRQRTVVFGGGSGGGSVWEWDGIDWVEVAAPGGPGASLFDAMAYDVMRRRCVIYAGRGGWEWDGARWTSIPWGPQSVGAMTYDLERRETLVFASNTLWSWDGSTWTQEWGTADFGDGAPKLVTDQARGTVLAFGGSSWGGWQDDPMNTTAAWDGRQWIDQRPTHAPPGRDGCALFEDSLRQRIVLFGGGWRGKGNQSFHGDTWQWDGTDWTELQPALSPSPRRDVAAAFDAGRGRGVVFGGGGYCDRSGCQVRGDETWEWDGSTWQQIATAVRPSARVRAAMAYDPVRARCILFGGRGDGGLAAARETWAYDGTAWTLLQPATTPPGRNGHAMIWDESRRRIVLSGGSPSGGGGPLADTWEWDGQDWTEIVTATTPGQGVQAGRLAFDPLRNAPLAAAGGGAAWILSARRPASASDFGTGCASAGAAGVIPVLGSPLPELGARSFRFTLSTGAPHSLAVVAVASRTQQLALGAQCTLYLAGELLPVAAITNASGVAVLPAALPADPGLVGVTLHAQGVVFDRGGTPGDASWTARRTLVVGS